MIRWFACGGTRGPGRTLWRRNMTDDNVSTIWCGGCRMASTCRPYGTRRECATLAPRKWLLCCGTIGHNPGSVVKLSKKIFKNFLTKFQNLVNNIYLLSFSSRSGFFT